MEKYKCKKGNQEITRLDITYFVLLSLEGILSEKKEKEAIKELKIFGENKEEITECVQKHFETCPSCKNLYEKEVISFRKKRVRIIYSKTHY